MNTLRGHNVELFIIKANGTTNLFYKKRCPWNLARAMKTYGIVEIQLHSFRVSTQDGDERSASSPGRFTCGKGLGTHWTGD